MFVCGLPKAAPTFYFLLSAFYFLLSTFCFLLSTFCLPLTDYSKKLYFFQQFGNYISFGNFTLCAVLFEDNSTAVAACDTHICFTGFTGAVYDTSHNSNGDVLVHILYGFLDHLCGFHKVDTCSSAGRA